MKIAYTKPDSYRYQGRRQHQHNYSLAMALGSLLTGAFLLFLYWICETINDLLK